jgi:hypothetical protein
MLPYMFLNCKAQQLWWVMSFGLEMCSIHFCGEQLKILAHIPLNFSSCRLNKIVLGNKLSVSFSCCSPLATGHMGQYFYHVY